ncbi:hypothetical protein TNCV_1278951 [Trichonephila clavipes]|nr:hypothetical protein TNCV_1278951 [Trichonephila clavipes]
MGDFMYAEYADMHYMYSSTNANGRAALRMYHAQFPDQRMRVHRIFRSSHHQLRETRWFHVTRNDAVRRRAPVQAVNPADYLIRLPVGGTAKCAAAGLHSSCDEQL